MTKVLQSQIVGMHFRPPAKAVLGALPQGAELILEPEFDNPYDEWAIRVLVRPEVVPKDLDESLELQCLAMGHDWMEMRVSGEPIHLGYCISAGNKKLGSWAPNTAVAELIRQPGWTAHLGFSAEGQAFVEVTEG